MRASGDGVCGSPVSNTSSQRASGATRGSVCLHGNVNWTLDARKVSRLASCPVVEARLPYVQFIRPLVLQDHCLPREDISLWCFFATRQWTMNAALIEQQQRRQFVRQRMLVYEDNE